MSIPTCDITLSPLTVEYRQRTGHGDRIIRVSFKGHTPKIMFFGEDTSHRPVQMEQSLEQIVEFCLDAKRRLEDTGEYVAVNADQERLKRELHLLCSNWSQ